MSDPVERLRILKMVQEGKITAEYGIQLLEALDSGAGKVSGELPDGTVPGSSARGPRWLRVQVTDTDTGKVRVNVRMPISVVNAGLKMGARFSPEVQGLDADLLMGYIRAGETGKIMDMLDDQDGEHVEVFLE